MKSVDELTDYLNAVPLVAIAAYGLGPVRLGDPSNSPRARLGTLRGSQLGHYTAIDTAGTIGRQLLSVVTEHGGEISAEVLAQETGDVGVEALVDATDRLCAAGVLQRCANSTGSGQAQAGSLALSADVRGWFGPNSVSMRDQHAITNESLALICKELGVAVPARKQERIDVVAEVFANPQHRAAVEAALSPAARATLEGIVSRGGPGVVPAGMVGLEVYDLHLAAAPRYAIRQIPSSPELSALLELTSRGIVGVSEYEREIWVWREAWPFVNRPFYPAWPQVVRPDRREVKVAELRVPPVMVLVDRALDHWATNPPAVLKKDELRLAKTVVRSTAKALGSDEDTIETISRLLLATGLLLRNTAATSGRGRNRRVDQLWMIDPDLMEAWLALPVAQRWLRLVSEWTRPSHPVSDQLLANRQLLLWELSLLPADRGWSNAKQVAGWLDQRYEPVGNRTAFEESLRDVAILDLVPSSGPIALTALGRLALADPANVAAAEFGRSDQATVLADHTIVAPPDIDPEIAGRLARISVLESDAGARVYRLDEALITGAVQAGDSAEEICGFLDELSSVPLPDSVRRLIEDGASRAGRVKVVSTTTIVVTSDPVDLVTACSVKAAKLTAISPTVAVSDVPAAKVRTALDRKGLSPELVTGGEIPVARRSSDDAAVISEQAERAMAMAERHGYEHFEVHARQLAQRAAAANDPASRLVVTGPLALTPDLVERMSRQAAK